MPPMSLSNSALLIFFKMAVTSVSIFTSINTSTLFYIEANSSNFATGVVLFQITINDGKYHSVVYFSKVLSLVEQIYKIHNKKMLAII